MNDGLNHILRHDTGTQHGGRDLGDRQWPVYTQRADSGVFTGNLQRGYTQTIAEREGGAFNVCPTFAVQREVTAALTADTQIGGFTQTKGLIKLHQHLGRHRQRNVGYRDITGFLQYAGDGQSRPVANVFNQVAIDSVRPGIQYGVRAYHVTSQPGHNNSGFTVEPGSKLSLIATLRMSFGCTPA